MAGDDPNGSRQGTVGVRRCGGFHSTPRDEEGRQVGAWHTRDRETSLSWEGRGVRECLAGAEASQSPMRLLLCPATLLDSSPSTRKLVVRPGSQASQASDDSSARTIRWKHWQGPWSMIHREI